MKGGIIHIWASKNQESCSWMARLPCPAPHVLTQPPSKSRWNGLSQHVLCGRLVWISNYDLTLERADSGGQTYEREKRRHTLAYARIRLKPPALAVGQLTKDFRRSSLSKTSNHANCCSKQQAIPTEQFRTSPHKTYLEVQFRENIKQEGE